MRISDEIIDYVGILAKLDLNAQEKEQAKTDMSNMLDYIDKLNELATDTVEAMSHISPIYNVFREDVVCQRTQEGREKILYNAPKQKEGCFVVPRTVE